MIDEVAAFVNGAQDESSDLVQRQANFGKLVLRFEGMVYGYALAILGDPCLAEDAVQEAFIAAYIALPQLQHPHAFPMWLRRIVYTHCLRLLRQRQRTPLSLDTIAEVAIGSPPQQLLEEQELQREVWAVIQTLPWEQRIPVILYYMDAYSQQEIADFLDLTVAAVKKRLERARKQLEWRMQPMAHEYLDDPVPAFNAVFDQSVQLSILMDNAAGEGQCLLLEQLLMEGVDVNASDSEGQTLLHWAVKAGNAEAVEVLLQAQPDLRISDRSGRTALQWAEARRFRTVMALLQKYLAGTQAE